eukprot:UC4_evm5s776
MVRENIVGRESTIETPFGFKKIVYCDSTASGRNLHFVEDFLRDQVMPIYANTHSSASATGRQTHFFFTEARDIVKNSLGGDDRDTLIFAGSGCTGAVEKFIQILGLHRRDQRKTNKKLVCKFPGCGKSFKDAKSLRLHGLACHSDGEQSAFKPERCIDINSKHTWDSEQDGEEAVVFVSKWEHHSNLLPWRESTAKVIEIKDHESTGIDIEQLKMELKKHDGKLKIGSFCAGSNVTGCRRDVYAITKILKEHGALACWDFAAAAPHISVNMNESRDYSIDAIFLSPHKLPGGPGILLIKQSLLTNFVPSVPGGGTVFFVSSTDHTYLENYEERETGGTPDILGAVRCGLVFRTRDAIGIEAIEARERVFLMKAFDRWSKIDNLHLLGGTSVKNRLPIVSFLISHGDKFLHHNFITALLNDLFGIQCRGGCMCAGPLGLSLLGISPSAAQIIEGYLLEKVEVLRPGFVRVSFDFTMEDEEADTLIECVEFIARNGIKFLPLYMFYSDTGEWKYRGEKTQRKWLSSLIFDEVSYVYFLLTVISFIHVLYIISHIKAPTLKFRMKSPRSPQSKSAMLLQAREIIENLNSTAEGKHGDVSLIPESIEKQGLRWFMLPSDIHSFGALSNIGHADKSLEEVKLIPKFAQSKIIIDDIKREKTCTLKMEKKRTVSAINEQANKRVKTSACKSDYSNSPEKYNRKEFKKLFPVPPKKEIMKPVGLAISEFAMIKEGDRVLVGLSGGKDSLTLLHVLLNLRKRAPIKFDLAAVTMDPKYPGYNPKELKPYVASLGIPYFFENENTCENSTGSLMEFAKTSDPKSICSWCSRMKRGILYSVCRREGYNVLALGQHLDDNAESLLMSAFHNGKLRTMKACYQNDAGDVRIIRPLCYVRESSLRKFAEESGLPVITENCPACFDAPQERYRIKTLLSQQEHLHPGIFQSLQRAMKPLMREGTK